jgi:hypothetical protein
LDEDQQTALRALAGQVMSLLDLRLKNSLLELKNAEINRLNKDLGAFTYRLSHDLKTPIRGIKSVTEWFREDYWSDLDVQAKEWIDKITSRAEYMEALTEGLLKYSRITQTPIKTSTFNLKQLLGEVLEILSDSEALTLEHTGTDQDLTHYKFGFQSIFQNLISNSIAHSDKPDVWIGISYISHPDFHELTYRDNGPGIAYKYKNRIFEIFETLGVKNKNSSGIGLATVLAILKSIGGTIRLEEQKPGEKGIHFTLTFPLRLPK